MASAPAAGPAQNAAAAISTVLDRLEHGDASSGVAMLQRRLSGPAAAVPAPPLPERHFATRTGWLRPVSLLFLALLGAVGAEAGGAPGC